VLGSAAVAQLAAPQREAYRIAQAQSVQLPYLGIAAGLLVLASLAYLLRLPRSPRRPSRPIRATTLSARCCGTGTCASG